jgi:hypothetical protein
MYPYYTIRSNERYLLHPRNTRFFPQCQPVPGNRIEPLLAHRILDPVMRSVRQKYASSAFLEELEHELDLVLCYNAAG